MGIIKRLKRKIRTRKLVRDIARFERWRATFKVDNQVIPQNADYKKFCEGIAKFCKEINDECDEGDRQVRLITGNYTADDLIKGGGI